MLHKNRKEHGRTRMKKNRTKISDQKHENELKEKRQQRIINDDSGNSSSEIKSRLSFGTHGEICLRYKVWTVYYVVLINNRCPGSLPLDLFLSHTHRNTSDACMCAYVHSNFIIIFSPLLMLESSSSCSILSCCRSHFNQVFGIWQLSQSHLMIYWLWW